MKNDPDLLEDEHRLWTRFRNGNKDALGQLAARHYGAMYNYGKKFSRDPEFIRDSIQELFLGLWERRSHISDTAFVKSYLFKALRNTIIDESIRLKRFREPDELSFDPNPTDSGVELFIIQKESLEQQVHFLQRVISQLTKRQREIVYLRFYQGLSNQETADVMGLGYQSVCNLLHRTLKEIKEHWLTAGLYAALLTVFA